ncbi:YceI family protein [Undibacterium cyanobacteriorum]|uniref:YceI family protein n=1 Tax=Undibacterium cyanobacteriorum TaxID=3073561 RepID=A0ABY9REZ7_9BURK|nr:YceI family protein [Undibacterium sp. 20NA77.5]WMW79787.1 YceI family protein [Undibacterium sp. 20NA77.5]
MTLNLSTKLQLILSRAVLWLGVSLFTCVSARAADLERYRIDPDHTFTFFEYKHWGLSLQRGRFDRSTGSVEIDFEARTGKVVLEIETGSISTGVGLFDNRLKSSQFFDSERFPKIVFTSNRLIFDEQNNLQALEGLLRIKDVSKVVRFDLHHFHCRFMPLYFARACGANGSAKILRSEFDLGSYAPFVSDEVTLWFNLEAIKE